MSKVFTNSPCWIEQELDDGGVAIIEISIRVEVPDNCYVDGTLDDVAEAAADKILDDGINYDD